MPTITTDTFLDGGTARTAGESWTINGCTLTIRTDTRWHANAPASMTGTLSTVSSSINDMGFVVEGRNVRWMKFDSGAGLVPAIGTTITQGGVSGYLLGVWADLTSAPTAVGASMPSTGYMKFREVSGGQFVASSAISGISANPLATPGSGAGADAPGWIEVVRDASSSMNGVPLGAGFVFNGAWFDLGTTSGSPNQTIQVPTNGGGAGTLVNGIQIETSPGSGVYEWYPALNSTRFATCLKTDIRNKFVYQAGNGAVIIGSNGTTTLAYTPPTGCKIRIPNIFLRQATTAARASNLVAASTGTWPNATAVKMTASIVEMQWVLYVSNFRNISVTDASLSYTQMNDQLAGPHSFTNTLFTDPLGSLIYILNCTGNTNRGLTFTNCVFQNAYSQVTAFAGLSNATFTSCKFISIVASRSSPATITFTAPVSINVAFSSCTFFGCIVNASPLSNCTFTNTDYIERHDVDAQATGQGNYIWSIAADCQNVTIDGLTFGVGGALANCHTLGCIMQVSNIIGNVTLQNIGTFASPLPCGSVTASSPQYIAQGFSNFGMYVNIKRVFLSRVRFGHFNFSTGSNIVIEQCGTPGFTVVNAAPAMKESLYKGMIASNWGGTSAGFVGSLCIDQFVDSTTGNIILMGADPGVLYAPYTSWNFPTSSSGFTTAGVKLVGTTAWYQVETPYWVKGHTGFQNVAATVSGTNYSGVTLQYQIDTGSGWSAVKNLTAANISAETISPTTGFKLRVIVPGQVSNTTSFTSVKIPTTTNTSEQAVALYPLSVSTMTLTGLVAGSEIRCYTGTDPATAVEIGGTESSGTSFSFTHSAGGTAGFIRIFALGYQPVNYDPYTFSSTDTTLLVQQTIDRNYVNP